jgi:hypothetical protein
MARDLGEVLHYFLDEPPLAAPVLTVPVAAGDGLRAALAWSLAVESARAGDRATWVAPASPDAMPAPGGAPGAGLRRVDVPRATPDALFAAAASEAAAPPGGAPKTDRVWTALPPDWLDAADPEGPLLRQVLLLVTPETRDLERAFGLARGIVARAPGARLGVTVHRVETLDEARDAFLSLATACEQEWGRPLTSYGLLLDDVQVYRSAVSGRPLAGSRADGRAARALRDVVRLLREDAGGQPPGRPAPDTPVHD